MIIDCKVIRSFWAYLLKQRAWLYRFNAWNVTLLVFFSLCRTQKNVNVEWKKYMYFPEILLKQFWRQTFPAWSTCINYKSYFTVSLKGEFHKSFYFFKVLIIKQILLVPQELPNYDLNVFWIFEEIFEFQS